MLAAEAAVRRQDGRTFYEVRLPGAGRAAGQRIRTSFLVNDADGRGRDGFLQWTPGIGLSKEPAAFGYVELWPAEGAPPPPPPEPDASGPGPGPMPDEGVPGPVGDVGALPGGSDALAAGDVGAPGPDRGADPADGPGGRDAAAGSVVDRDGGRDAPPNASGRGDSAASGCQIAGPETRAGSGAAGLALWVVLALARHRGRRRRVDARAGDSPECTA
jgi:hypothetical protein